MNIKFPVMQSDISDMIKQLNTEEKTISLQLKHIKMQRELLQEACEHLDYPEGGIHTSQGRDVHCPSCGKAMEEVGIDL